MTAKTWKDTPRWQRVSVYVTGGLLAAVVALIAAAPEPKASPEQLQLQAQKAQGLDDQFSRWDGSHIKMTVAIRKTMNDPKSFEHIETKYRVNTNGTVRVVTEFTGRNAFGGVVRQKVSGLVDAKTGDVLELAAIQ